jgi:hypothetical protein
LAVEDPDQRHVLAHHGGRDAGHDTPIPAATSPSFAVHSRTTNFDLLQAGTRTELTFEDEAPQTSHSLLGADRQTSS